MKKIPSLLNDFMNRVAPPRESSPVKQLESNTREPARDSGLGPMPSNRESTDYVVELRIREWMMRVQKEAEEARKLKELHERLNHPHEKTPPKGPNNSNKISPP